MNVFVLIREDQNDHGFVDTSVAGIYADKQAALSQRRLEEECARDEGLLVDDDETEGGEWQVSWKIEEHVVQ